MAWEEDFGRQMALRVQTPDSLLLWLLVAVLETLLLVTVQVKLTTSSSIPYGCNGFIPGGHGISNSHF